MKITIGLISTFFAVVLLSSCGFTLRQQNHLKKDYKHLSVVSYKPYSRLTKELKSTLRQLELQSGSKSNKNSYQLHILNEQFSERVITVSASTNVRQIIISYRVTFELDNQEQTHNTNPITVTTQSPFSLNANQMLASNYEKETIKNDLRKRVIFLILRRVGSPKTKQQIK